MTSPPELVDVVCPECGTEYRDSIRASINTYIEPWTEEEILEATTCRCPECGTRVGPGGLVTMTYGDDEDGVVLIAVDGPEQE